MKNSSNEKQINKNEGKMPLCPICQKNAQQDYRPFCSKQCADIDLGRWFKGSYAIPASMSEVEEESIPESLL